MKQLLIIIISILFISPCFSQLDLLPAFPNEISYSDGIAYFNGSPFTGLLVEEKTNKQLGEFKNGYKNGLFTEYYNNGKKKNEGKYTLGLKEGAHTEWFENGNKKSEITFSNGKLNGMYEEWFINEKKKYEGIYINNEHNGKHIEFNEKGQKTKETTYKDDLIIREDFYSNGILESTSEIKTEYFSDGTKKAEGLLKNNKKEGLWTSWYEYTQNLQDKSYYKNDTLNGEYISYENKGKTLSYDEYALSISEQGKYLNGKREGVWTCAGVGTGKYINDKREGVWTYWFDNGKKITEKTFLNGKLIHEETKTVANLVSNFNKTNNSFLFKTPENDKVIVRFDFILQNKDDNTGEVIKVISGNLYSSYRLVPISAIGSDKDESINYIIECTNIDVEFETTQVNSTKNGLYYVYKCNISVTLTLKNSEGETINLKTYSHGSGFLVFTSKQGAFDSANKTDYITKFICKNLPIKTRITTIEDKDSDGAAKTITITGGANIGIYSCEFEVFDEQNKSIGIIKTKDIFSNSTTCKVKTGGDAISLKINQGVKLKVVSIE